MRIFIDTSAIYARLNADDTFHSTAAMEMRYLLANQAEFITTQYVVAESSALIQARMGMKKLAEFHRNVEPVFLVHQVSEAQHQRAVDFCLAMNRRKLSLVDCSSFTVMRDLSIDRVFTFDAHFQEQGFHCIGLPKQAD